MEEPELVERLKKRDARAFSVLVARYQGPIYGTCLRVLGNGADADDVAQEVFIRCFQRIDTYRGESTLRAWLFRVAVNLCRNRLASRKSRPDSLPLGTEDHPADHMPGDEAVGVTSGTMKAPDAAIEADPPGREPESLILKALARLDPHARELLVLRDVEGLAYAELQAILGMNEGTLKSSIHRARAALREAFERLRGQP